MKKIKNIIILLFIILSFIQTCLAELSVESHKKISSKSIEVIFSEPLAAEPIEVVVIDNKTKKQIEIIWTWDWISKKVKFISWKKIPDDYRLKIISALWNNWDRISSKTMETPTIEALDKTFEKTVLNKDEDINNNNNNPDTNSNNEWNKTENTGSSKVNKASENNKNEENSDTSSDNKKNTDKVLEENKNNSDNIESKTPKVTLKEYNPEEIKNKQSLLIIWVLFSIFLIIWMYIISKMPEEKSNKKWKKTKKIK